MLGLGIEIEGRYEILRKLGEGGFGIVYEARSARTGQSVAIKVLQSSAFLDEQAEIREKRFLREAKLCAGLCHPNIVPLLDAGHTEDGRYYMVFAFVPGVTLAQCLAREAALEPREAQYLMLQVLDALACAHEHGIIHRDLKPSNIMLLATGARRNATVVDFGIAKDNLSPMNTPLTATRESLGTLGYCAPEQVRGAPLTANADLFAWGVIFLECLTGKRVFDGTSAAQVLFQQLGSEPVPVPAVLERHPVGEVIRRATQKDPAQRQDSARELLEALDACSVRDLSRELLTGATPARLAVSGVGGPALNRTESPISDKSELRQVTALCCCFDVVCREREPVVGELDEVLQGCVTAAARVARERGGHIVTALGNQLLVFHGLFESAEDDAIQAGLAAKDIQAQLREENRALASRGIHVVERVGLHAGLVLTHRGRAGDELGLRIGVTARVTAEVAVQAPPTTILATDETRDLLRQRFVLESDSTRAINGAPVELYRVGEVRAEVSHTGPLDTQQSPFVGRKEEMDLLLSRWRSPKGCAVLVTSGPGTGKTRLLREFRKRIQGQPHAFAEGHCSPNAQKHPLYPVMSLLQGLLDLDVHATPHEQCARVEQALGEWQLNQPEYLQLLGQLLGLPIYGPSVLAELSPQKRKQLTRNAILALLGAMAERQPVLLFLEDCQYADPSTCEFLNELLQEANGTRIWVFLTARPEFASPFSTPLLQLQLNRLDDSQSVALARAVAGNKALPGPVVHQILERTDGVPLFIEELTRALIGSRSLRERDDQYVLAGTLSDLEVPTTLRSLLTAKLDRLGRAKETAQLAAVLGREFDRDLLAMVSPAGESAVDADLNRLMAAGLVQQRRRIEGRCVFRHALICDAAYESLPPAARIQAHACVALTIEEKFPALVDQRPDLLAHHYAAAERKVQAVRYAQAAAQLALDRSSYAEALSSVSDAYGWLEALPPGERVAAELQANAVKTQALMATRGWGDPEVKALVDRSTALLSELEGNDALKVHFGWAKFAFCHTSSDRQGAFAAGRELVSFAETSQDAAFLSAAYTMLGLARQVDGEFHEAVRALEIAMKHYRNVDREAAKTFQMDSRALAEAIQGHLAYWSRGDDVQAFELVESAVRWAKELQHVSSIAIALLYGAQVYQAAGDKPKVAAMASEILALSAKYGLPAFEGYAATIAAWASGDVERVDDIVRQLEALGCKIGLSYWASLPAEIAAERGHFDQAIECIRRCIERCCENDEHYFEPELLRRLGEYLLVHQPCDEVGARDALEKSASMAQQRGAYRVELMARVALQQRLWLKTEQDARIQYLLSEYPHLRDITMVTSQSESRVTHNKESAHAC